MELIIDELDTELEQDFISTKNQIIKHIRPHIYIKNNPSGSLTLEVYDEDENLIQASNTLSIADIKTQANITGDEFHGYIRFDFDGFGVKEDDIVTIKLVASGGYSFNETDFVGVCRDFDLRKYPPSFTPSGGIFSVLDYEIYELKFLNKGSY